MLNEPFIFATEKQLHLRRFDKIKMGTKEKLTERFKGFPKDFTFDEMERLLSFFGYCRDNKGRTSGSRVVFKNGDSRPLMLHKPHPGNIVKMYALKQVLKI
ncbi:hypothetical protein Barb7_00955 [Bacteroidales bacterium Barb7]|nr:hypothetical protein Barb7_00955 [Bacteroidales bacterium Barb7]